MQDIITSYLLQSKHTALPGIGSLSISSIPAEVDKVNNLILPSADEFIFSENISHSSHDLVKYIARKKDIDINAAEEELRTFCGHWKEKINSGNELYFETFGSLQKNEAGTIVLKKDKNSQFLAPVPATILPKEAIHTLLADDNLVSTSTTADYYNDDVVETKSAWLQWAIILCAVALVALFFNYYDRRFSLASTGNQSHFFVTSPGNTYLIPEP